MGNALGYLKKTFAPNGKDDFVETNIGFPCRVVTGNKAVQSVFDIDQFRKEEFCPGLGEVRKEFTGGICPSITSNGKIHEKNKGLMLDVMAKASEEIPASAANAVLSNIAKWGSNPSDFESKPISVAADALLPTIFGESAPFEADEMKLYFESTITLRAYILAALTAGNLDEGRQAMKSILGKMKTSESLKTANLHISVRTSQLLFSVMFNGVRGIQANLLTTIARLDTITAEDREELREEALAALRKHGGVTREALQEMPKIESFVLEALRTGSSPVFWSTIATRPTTVKYTTESGEHEVEIKEGERVYASPYWALKDPAVFDKPDEFVWRRFLGPEGEALREHHVSFHGRLVDTPAVNNHMCPGKDVALTVIRASVAIFNTFFDWELQEPPVWTGTYLRRAGQPDKKVNVKSFWLQHPEDLKEIFPSHFKDIFDPKGEVSTGTSEVKLPTESSQGSCKN